MSCALGHRELKRCLLDDFCDGFGSCECGLIFKDTCTVYCMFYGCVDILPQCAVLQVSVCCTYIVVLDATASRELYLKGDNDAEQWKKC